MRAALNRMRAWLAKRDNQRDVIAGLGLVLLWAGLDRIYPGAGMAVAGWMLVAIAVLVR